MFFDGGKKKKNEPYDLDKELQQSYKNVMSFDDKPAIDIIKGVSVKTGINPSLLFSSAYQEGMNKAILKPDEVSEAFINAENNQGLDTNTYPVDGFYNYGLDTFGQKYDQLKKYLPEGFDSRFKTFKAKNEKGENITTAAFMTNEDALMAKSAMLKNEQDNVLSYAKQNNITIQPDDIDYFTLAAYNTGFGNAKKMLNEYSKAKDKRMYIDKGLTSFQSVHKNISPRLRRMKLIQSLLAE